MVSNALLLPRSREGLEQEEEGGTRMGYSAKTQFTVFKLCLNNWLPGVDENSATVLG